MDKSRQVDKSIRDINDGIKGIRPRSQSSFQGLTSQARSRNSFLHNICHLPTPSVPSVPSAIFHHHHLGPPWTALDHLGPSLCPGFRVVLRQVAVSTPRNCAKKWPQCTRQTAQPLLELISDKWSTSIDTDIGLIGPFDRIWCSKQLKCKMHHPAPASKSRSWWPMDDVLMGFEDQSFWTSKYIAT